MTARASARTAVRAAADTGGAAERTVAAADRSADRDAATAGRPAKEAAPTGPPEKVTVAAAGSATAGTPGLASPRHAETGGLALVLSGGGAPAAYFGAGVIRAVAEAGRTPRIVSGVSAGSINAAALAVGLDADALAEMWSRVRWQDIFRPRFDVWRLVNLPGLLRPTANIVEYALGAIGWTWLLDTAPAKGTLDRYLGGRNLQVRPDTTLIVSAVDENTGDVIRFCSALPPEHRLDGQFHRVRMTTDHVLASASVPMLFPPGRYHDHTLVDAGLVANTPLAPAMRYEPDCVIVVSGAGVTRPARTPASLGEAISLLVDNVAHAALYADVNHTHTANKLAQAAPQSTSKRYVPMLMIEPTDLGFSVNSFLRFSPRDALRIMDYGRETAAKALANWNA
jgi:NTE family protein